MSSLSLLLEFCKLEIEVRLLVAISVSSLLKGYILIFFINVDIRI